MFPLVFLFDIGRKNFLGLHFLSPQKFQSRPLSIILELICAYFGAFFGPPFLEQSGVAGSPPRFTTQRSAPTVSCGPVGLLFFVCLQPSFSLPLGSCEIPVVSVLVRLSLPPHPSSPLERGFVVRGVVSFPLVHCSARKTAVLFEVPFGLGGHLVPLF